MSKNFALDFGGFLDYARQIDELGGSDLLKKATENALKATDEYLTPEIEKAMQASPHNFKRTGKTAGTLDKNYDVEWTGRVAKVKVGFKISEGGLASIFLAYGTPHIKPDVNLRKALRGEGKYKKQIAEIQKAEFNKIISEGLNND